MLRKLQLRRYEWGAFYMAISAFFTTLFGLFVKIGVENIYLPWMLFLRFSVPLCFVLCYFGFRKSLVKEISFRGTGKHVLRAVAVLISQLSLFYYFTRGNLTNGVMLLNTAPMFMPIITYVFFRHKTRVIVWFSLLVSFSGVLLILKPTHEAIDPFSIFGFISGLAMAVSQVIYGVNRESDTLVNNMFLYYFYTSILSGICLVCFLGAGGFQRDFLLSSHHGIFLPILAILLVGIGTAMNQLLWGTAYSYARPASLSPFIYLAVVFSAIVDNLLHPGMIHGFSFILGIVLVIAGSLMPVVYTKQLL